MKNVKLVIFIFIMMLLQTLVTIYANFWGIVPSIIFPFVIAYAIIERELSYAAAVSLICGLIASVISNREFFMVMLMYLLGGVLTYMLKGNKVPKAQGS